MSDEKILELQEQTNCDPLLAKLLIKFTGGDTNGAMEILRSVDRDIFIVKGKFIGQTINLYGTFIILYNVKLKSFDKVEVLAKSEDKAAIEFDFEKKWDQFAEDIVAFKKRDITEISIHEKFMNYINSQRTHIFFDSKLNSRKEKETSEEEFKRFFVDVVSAVIGDVDVAIKLRLERTDIFDVNKAKTGSFFIEEDLDEPDEQKIDKTSDNQFLFLDIEPVLSPVSGKSISDIEPGDRIGVKIIDERPVASYICELLNGKDSNSNLLKTVFAKLKDLEKTDDGYFLSVEFGPGIYGNSYFAEDVKIEVPEEDKKESRVKKEKSKSEKESKEVKENFFVKNMWVIGGVTLLIIFILLISFLSD